MRKGMDNPSKFTQILEGNRLTFASDKFGATVVKLLGVSLACAQLKWQGKWQ